MVQTPGVHGRGAPRGGGAREHPRRWFVLQTSPSTNPFARLRGGLSTWLSSTGSVAGQSAGFASWKPYNPNLLNGTFPIAHRCDAVTSRRQAFSNRRDLLGPRTGWTPHPEGAALNQAGASRSVRHPAVDPNTVSTSPGRLLAASRCCEDGSVTGRPEAVKRSAVCCRKASIKNALGLRRRGKLDKPKIHLSTRKWDSPPRRTRSPARPAGRGWEELQVEP
jgi:hypothetical protein